MAARRLVIAVVALLVISTVVALVATDIEEDRSNSQTGSTQSETPAQTATDPDDAGWASSGAGGDADLVEHRIEVSARPQQVVASPGDRVVLEVSGDEPAEVTVPAFGRYETLDPAAPVRFDLITPEPGIFEVRATTEPKPVAVLHITEGTRGVR